MLWGLAFKESFFFFSFFGVIAGLIICLMSVAPVIAYQRTKERIRDIVVGVGGTWGSIGIIIGVLGLAALAVRFIFFKN